jgi:hypothetical protein
MDHLDRGENLVIYLKGDEKMKDAQNLHLKVQELCDCFSTTDPLKEMSEIKTDDDRMEAALKWLALSALHGVNNNAKKITVKKTNDGNVSVTAEYRDTELPSPGPDVADHIFEAVRKMTYLEDRKGKSEFSLGLGNSSLDLIISVKDKDDYKKVSLKFP